MQEEARVARTGLESRKGGIIDKPHKKLDLWKLSMEFVLDIFDITKTFPIEEKYVLIPQVRRSVLSIPSNIAEGAGRNTKKEFANFLHVAQGSLSELDTQLEIALKLKYIATDLYDKLNTTMERIDKMLTGLIRNQLRAKR